MDSKISPVSELRRDVADIATARLFADALSLYTPAAHNGIEGELLSEGQPPVVVLYRDDSLGWCYVDTDRRTIRRGFVDPETARQDALSRLPGARILRVAA